MCVLVVERMSDSELATGKHPAEEQDQSCRKQPKLQGWDNSKYSELNVLNKASHAVPTRQRKLLCAVFELQPGHPYTANIREPFNAYFDPPIDIDCLKMEICASIALLRPALASRLNVSGCLFTAFSQRNLTQVKSVRLPPGVRQPLACDQFDVDGVVFSQTYPGCDLNQADNYCIALCDVGEKCAFGCACEYYAC